jgi:hypothetical protein
VPVVAGSRRPGRGVGAGAKGRPQAPLGPRRPVSDSGNLPTNPVRVSVATPEELRLLELRLLGRRRPDPLPQRRWKSDLRDEWAGFLEGFGLDVVFTLTFTDDYARAHFVYSPTSALNDFERFLKLIDYQGQYLACAEPHFDRDVPHLHGLMESKGLPLVNFWREWFTTRGRARFEPPRSDASRYYCTKYALKERDSDLIRFRLQPKTRRAGGRR